MKATGIVRRMDDLGRVVIPKEIRRAMRIETGSPMEIFTDGDAVCFKLYRPYGEHDWEKVFKALKPIIPSPFVLLNAYKETEQQSSKYAGEPTDIVEIHDDDDEVVGYVGVSTSDDVTAELAIAAKVAKAILSED